jgi:hypothetical protein
MALQTKVFRVAAAAHVILQSVVIHPANYCDCSSEAILRNPCATATRLKNLDIFSKVDGNFCKQYLQFQNAQGQLSIFQSLMYETKC